MENTIKVPCDKFGRMIPAELGMGFCSLAIFALSGPAFPYCSFLRDRGRANRARVERESERERERERTREIGALSLCLSLTLRKRRRSRAPRRREGTPSSSTPLQAPPYYLLLCVLLSATSSLPLSLPLVVMLAIIPSYSWFLFTVSRNSRYPVLYPSRSSFFLALALVILVC